MREYLTARDIEDLVARGVHQIPITDGVVLTDLAKERAAVLGVDLVQPGQARQPSNPAPANTPSPTFGQPTSTAPRHISLGPKPKGCLHGHLEAGRAATRPPAPTGAEVAARANDTGSLVDRLVDAVRRLNQ
jgi:hypothetical protein